MFWHNVKRRSGAFCEYPELTTGQSASERLLIRVSQPCATLHLQLRLETASVAADGGNCEHATVALVGHRAVSCFETSVDFDFIPLLSVADVVNCNVVMLAPKEGYGVVALAQAEHVPGRDLTL